MKKYKNLKQEHKKLKEENAILATELAQLKASGKGKVLLDKDSPNSRLPDISHL